MVDSVAASSPAVDATAVPVPAVDAIAVPDPLAQPVPAVDAIAVSDPLAQPVPITLTEFLEVRSRRTLDSIAEGDESSNPSMDETSSSASTGAASSYVDVPYHELRNLLFGQHEDSFEDFDVPIILLVHHHGRPLYKLILDVIDTNQQRVSMESQHHGNYYHTPYHGSFNVDARGNLRLGLRWFASFANMDSIPLVRLNLMSYHGYRGLYTSDCNRIRALRMYEFRGPDPESAARFLRLCDETIHPRFERHRF